MMKDVLYIDGRRTGYAPQQIERTMTVGELISWLEQYDDDTLVYLKNDNGYTYGEIVEESFSEDQIDENEEDY